MQHEKKEEESIRIRWESALYSVEVNFGLSPSRRKNLEPELLAVLHQSFINHPDYDSEHLPEFMHSDLYLRIFHGRDLRGIFTADLVRILNHPVLHLSSGFVLPQYRSGGSLMSLAMGLTLDLAAQSFGGDEFFAALRTANPRVVAKLWETSWVRFYPRLSWEKNDSRLHELAPYFCSQVFGADRCDMEGRIFYNIYPVSPWNGQIPWHYDEKVNNFCRSHLRPDGRDAFLFLGPTLPPMTGIPRRQVVWPLGSR